MKLLVAMLLLHRSFAAEDMQQPTAGTGGGKDLPAAVEDLTVDGVVDLLQDWRLHTAFAREFVQREYDGLTLTRYLSVDELKKEWESRDCNDSRGGNKEGAFCKADHTHFRRLADLITELHRKFPGHRNNHATYAAVGTKDGGIGVSMGDDGRRILSPNNNNSYVSGIQIKHNDSLVSMGEKDDVQLRRGGAHLLNIPNDVEVEGKLKVNGCLVDACVNSTSTRSSCSSPYFSLMSSESESFPPSCYAVWKSAYETWGGAYVPPNGVYNLTSNATGDNVNYAAYCDMANGGWELAMRVAADGSEFVFDSDYWENDELLNESSFDPSLASDDAKYATFTHASVGFLRGCFNGDTTAGKCNTHALPQEYASLSKMFSDVTIGIDGVAGGITFDDLTEAEHYQWLTNMGLDVDYCLEDTSGGTTMLWYAAGINLDDTTSLYDCRVRFGFMHNNQNSIYTANDAFGFGAQEVRACVRVWEREVAFVLERIYFECSATSLTAAVTD